MHQLNTIILRNRSRAQYNEKERRLNWNQKKKKSKPNVFSETANNNWFSFENFKLKF